VLLDPRLDSDAGVVGSPGTTLKESRRNRLREAGCRCDPVGARPFRRGALELCGAQRRCCLETTIAFDDSATSDIGSFVGIDLDLAVPAHRLLRNAGLPVIDFIASNGENSEACIERSVRSRNSRDY